MIPAHSLAETVARLAPLLERSPELETLVVAGDLVETGRPCPRTRKDVEGLAAWLTTRSCRLVWLAGNHDPKGKPALEETMRVGDWTIAHGHRPVAGDRLVLGHHHPVLRADGLTAPCFLVSDRLILLPAFSRNAAGLDIVRLPLPAGLPDAPLRCFAGLGPELLDFGPLADLRRQLA
jgi:metallophosphoesterase superfamily enzyme